MFVIPLQGDTKDNQAKFDSAAYLEQKKVAAKEFMIPHRWLQTGRWDWDGRWIATVMVIKVDRSPVTVQFAAADNTANKKDTEAICMESADSVGFSTGFSIAALVSEEDTATFLYRYPAQSLSEVLKTEVRARIQQDAASFCSKYPLDQLRSLKNEMGVAIREDVTAFYKNRGITITTIGQYGGMTYENPKIQEAIDKVFIAQQEKETAKATLAAVADTNTKSENLTQQDRKNVITLATGQAEAIRLVAEATAKGNLLKAQADAAGIEAVNKATQEASQNPLFLEVRKLDVQVKMYDKWLGGVPNMVISGTGVTPAVFLPMAAQSAIAQLVK
jgi:regulator of protease activity HflC (stomatin/prohibitin superfamily)